MEGRTSPWATIASTTTYLDLRLNNIFGEIADDDLAIAFRIVRLDRSSPGTGIASGLCVLLDATSRGGRNRSSAGGRSTWVATTTSSTALGGGDLVERLVELAGHDDCGVCANV
jgi:hypothetical protein